MIYVIDDVIPFSYQEELRKAMLDDRFPWFYKNDVTNPNTSYGNNAPALVHQFVIDGTINSPFWNAVSCIPHMAAREAGVSFKDVIRARGFMQFSLNLENLKSKVDPLHLDSDRAHYAIVYYLVDSDGDTLITSKKYDSTRGMETGLLVDDHEVIKRVTPKQGRAVLFDGSYYHTAEQPQSSSLRCIINFNVNKA
jgi:hypothetical protein